ncbi:HalOD1 output domain-containing protein [Haloprofundus halobius]|uniref:HalOD1 output domain-containing protein n=1 Tax=Haloprofundus halobius TaxID=2876194 RepID=UPI001CCFB15C|nr:HalOD1 output domain-containing protein [Haloprofundus halobius]
MDEKQSDSSSRDDTNQHSNETISPTETVDTLTPRESSDEGWTFVTQAHYDPTEARDLTTVIITAIADAEDVPIVDIRDPPLYEVVDVEAIENALFSPPEANRDNTHSTVGFRFNEYEVSVETDGWVTVYRRSGSAAADEE